MAFPSNKSTTAQLEVLRDGRREAMPVKLIERPLADSEGAGAPAARVNSAPAEPSLGLVVRDLDPALARRLDIPSSVHGVLVVRIDPAGPAFVPAMRRGFVIMEIN